MHPLGLREHSGKPVALVIREPAHAPRWLVDLGPSFDPSLIYSPAEEVFDRVQLAVDRPVLHSGLAWWSHVFAKGRANVGHSGDVHPSALCEQIGARYRVVNPTVLIALACSGPLRALPLTPVVDGDLLAVTYAVQLDASYTATPGAYAVVVDGNAVGVSGPAVLLTLGSPVSVGQVVTVAYTPGVDAIRSASGVLVAGFAGRAVDNLT